MKRYYYHGFIIILALMVTLSFVSCESVNSADPGGSGEREDVTNTMSSITTDTTMPNESEQAEITDSNNIKKTSEATASLHDSTSQMRSTVSTDICKTTTAANTATTTTTLVTPPFIATKTLESIRIRDPYIAVSEEEGVYYLFGTTYNSFSSDGGGFMYYKSYDQKLWDGPYDAFNAAAAGLKNRYAKYWAPEIHRYQGEYYMFATFGSNTTRHSVILKSTTGKIGGPYAVYSDAITPSEWSTLDATLYVEDGVPWMVYCREWVSLENKNGEMYAQRLSKDLKEPVGERRFLFKGSDAPGQTTSSLYVTDGPFLYKGHNGGLYMLWSTGIKEKGYTMLAARSSNGKMDGNWVQEKTPLYVKDGGHGMIYRDLSGKTCVALHTPNSKTEHTEIFVLTIDKNDHLVLY